MSHPENKNLAELVLEILTESEEPMSVREIARIITKKSSDNVSAKEINFISKAKDQCGNLG